MKNMQHPIKSILFVISSLTSGGAERVIVELANYYAAQDVKVSIILFSFDDVHYAVRPDVRLIFLCREITEKNRLSDIRKRFVLLRHYFTSLRPDIIVSFIGIVNIYSCAAALFTGCPLIISERNDPATVFSSGAMNTVRNLAYRLSDGYVFQTEDARKYFKGRIFTKSTVIANPIKAKLPKPYRGIRRKAIVACGRLTLQKNYGLLLEAFSRLDRRFSDYTLEIYGSGELLEELESKACGLGIDTRVRFLGVRDDWHEQAVDASLYVLSSDYEGVPNALMEAIACGIPSVSTDCPCGGPRMLIRDGENGLLVPVGDAERLKNAMEAVLSQTELSRRLSLNGVALRETYATEKIAARWSRYMRQVLERSF